MKQLLEILTLVLSLGVLFVAIPSQIWKNYKQKSADGLSVLLITLPMLQSLMRGSTSLLSFGVESYFVAVPDFFVVIFMLLILLQRRSYNLFGLLEKLDKLFKKIKRSWISGSFFLTLKISLNFLFVFNKFFSKFFLQMFFFFQN